MFCKDCGLKKTEQAIPGQTKFCKDCGQLVLAQNSNPNIPRPESGVVPQREEVTYFSEQFETIAHSVGETLKPVLIKVKDFGINAFNWVKANIVATGISLFILIGGFLAYKLFFAPNPEKAGREIASMDCDCINQHKIGISEAYQKMLGGFDNFGFTKRQEAYDKLNEIEKPLVENYEKCKDKVNAKAEKSYKGFKGAEFNVFQETYLSNSCTKRIYGSSVDSTAVFSETSLYSRDPILASNPLRSKILEKIDNINDPVPTIAKIKEDLIGKDFNSWRISYPSEILNIYVIKSENDQSSLRIETRLTFEDNQSKEKFYAIVNLFYSNAGGQWLFNRVDDKLLIKPEQNYFVGRELCVVGKWRWERNYATYYSDGTWEGRWDDGSTTIGTWRIFLNQFILKKNGVDWVTGEIEDFNAKELKVNFGNGTSTGQKLGQAPLRKYSNSFYLYN